MGDGTGGAWNAIVPQNLQDNQKYILYILET